MAYSMSNIIWLQWPLDLSLALDVYDGLRIPLVCLSKLDRQKMLVIFSYIFEKPKQSGISVLFSINHGVTARFKLFKIDDC